MGLADDLHFDGLTSAATFTALSTRSLEGVLTVDLIQGVLRNPSPRAQVPQCFDHRVGTEAVQSRSGFIAEQEYGIGN